MRFLKFDLLAILAMIWVVTSITPPHAQATPTIRDINRRFYQYLTKPGVKETIQWEDFFPTTLDRMDEEKKQKALALIRPHFQDFVAYLETHAGNTLSETLKTFLATRSADLHQIGTSSKEFEKGIHRLNEGFTRYELSRFSATECTTSNPNDSLAKHIVGLNRTIELVAPIQGSGELPISPHEFYTRFESLLKVPSSRTEKIERFRIAFKHKYESSVDFLSKIGPHFQDPDHLEQFYQAWKRNLHEYIQFEKARIDSTLIDPAQANEKRLALIFLEAQRKGRLSKVTRYLESLRSQISAPKNQRKAKQGDEEDPYLKMMRWDTAVHDFQDGKGALVDLAKNFKNTIEIGAVEDLRDHPGFVSVMEKTVQDSRLEPQFQSHFVEYELNEKTGSKRLNKIRGQLKRSLNQ